jgi:hypothetical protein
MITDCSRMQQHGITRRHELLKIIDTLLRDRQKIRVAKCTRRNRLLEDTTRCPIRNTISEFIGHFDYSEPLSVWHHAKVRQDKGRFAFSASMQISCNVCAMAARFCLHSMQQKRRLMH